MLRDGHLFLLRPLMSTTFNVWINMYAFVSEEKETIKRYWLVKLGHLIPFS